MNAVSGPIESSHMFLDMRNIQVEETEYTRAGRSCKPAMGFSFAAGTTDGPGAFDFKQSDTNGTAFWRLVRNFITTPTKDQEECHKPKPILLDVGGCCVRSCAPSCHETESCLLVHIKN